MEGILEAIKSIKLNPKSILSLILYLVMIWVIIPSVNLNIRIYGIRITIWASMILSVLGVILWLINKYVIKKNKGNLPGIAFLICSNDINKKDVEKNDFFKLLKDECDSLFNIIVYEKDDFKKYYKHNTSINDIMNDLNLSILFEVKERSGKVNGEERYEIEFGRTSIHFQLPIDARFSIALANDMTKSINKYISISEKNSLIDNKQEINMIKLTSMYLVAIMNILSSNPENAYSLLQNIVAITNVTNIPKEQYKYIVDQIPYRFLETNFNCIYNILYTKEYYNNEIILDNLENRLNNHLEMLEKYYRLNKINRLYYKMYYQDYLLQKAIVLYERRKVKDALDTINKCDFTIRPNSAPYYSKNFLLVMNDKYEEAAISYKKLLKRRDLDLIELNTVIKFINCRLDLDESNKKLKFCLAVINYYCADKEYAINTFNELNSNGEEFKEAINIILNDK